MSISHHKNRIQYFLNWRVPTPKESHSLRFLLAQNTRYFVKSKKGETDQLRKMGCEVINETPSSKNLIPAPIQHFQAYEELISPLGFFPNW
jgi:hypothetical protein